MKPARGTLGTVRARAQGALAAGALRPRESLDSVWQYIREGLIALAERADGELLSMPEAGLTQELVNELERRPGYRPYYFRQEDMEDTRNGRSPRKDLVVGARDDFQVLVNGVLFSGGQTFLALEAKRLPAPEKRRQKEYLTRPVPKESGQGEEFSEAGGVARFKRGVHARDLTVVGMIGYVQAHTFHYWQDTINCWVDELISAEPESWSAADKLELKKTWPRLAQLLSKNLRVSDNRQLTIHHLWVRLGGQAENEVNSEGKTSQFT